MSETLPPSTGRQIAFIDLEASGLGPKSWPIEVGWGFHGWPARSMLVKPHASWSLEAWEKTAEELHRISPDTLVRQGTAPLEVALVLNAAFANADVYSDAPSFDGFWLYRLYEAAGVRANFRLHNIASLISTVTDATPEDLFAKANEQEPHTHRAEQDVRQLQLVYELALQERR
ncbi:MAG: hypothetical protein MRY72_03405 [Aquisalinus sp.]|nr:hypothetical protein [Aquisalinus sp.]